MSLLHNLNEAIALKGRELILALMVLICGLLVARWIKKGLVIGLHRLRRISPYSMAIGHTAYFVVVAMVIGVALLAYGAKPINALRLIIIIALLAASLVLFLKPFIPSMPFKIGNTVKAADLLGKVEAITFLNTRLRTFDGKTFFVPNRQILNNIVINYHFTTTRRIMLDIGIEYSADLLNAKRTLEAVMTGDPRVKTKPSPAVYVLNLGDSCVELGGRCWVDNKDYWVARCDLVEKIKLRFDQEGIRFAFPQLDVHMNGNLPKAGGNGRPEMKPQQRSQRVDMLEEELT
jgi:small conductance mechanosensitive channel